MLDPGCWIEIGQDLDAPCNGYRLTEYRAEKRDVFLTSPEKPGNP